MCNYSLKNKPIYLVTGCKENSTFIVPKYTDGIIKLAFVQIASKKAKKIIFSSMKFVDCKHVRVINVLNPMTQKSSTKNKQM